MLAYNLGNLWRRLVLPGRIGNWSLTSLQQRLVKTGGRLIKHARYYWLLLAESHLTRRLFAGCGKSPRYRCRRDNPRGGGFQIDESRWLDGKGVSENRPGRGRSAVVLHPKWRNWRFRPQTVACAGEKCSKPCGTRSVCTMGVLKQKVIMEIPA